MVGFLLPGDDGYLPDGVYLDLPAEEYFRQGLGSTDLMSLWFRKEGWWWQSPFNPRRRRDTTKEQLYGSAAHAVVLEGVEAYESRFVAAPDWSQYPGLFDKVEDIIKAVADAGYRTTGAPMNKWVKDDWVQAIVDNDIDVPCKSAILKRFEDSIGRREVVSADDDWSLRLLREVMLDPDRADNAEIRGIFGDDSGFPKLVEVSIFHTMANGIRRRWRIDRMFPAFDLDLKTLGDWRGRPLPWATGDIIANRGYDIQRADYKVGRAAAYEYIRAGHLYGGTLEQRQWLETWPDLYPTWDWKWLFYQKPDAVKGHAPVLFPVHDDNDSDRERTGLVKAQKALQRFMTYRDRWGMEKPWARVEPLHYTDPNYDPKRAIQFPHHIDNVEDDHDYPDTPEEGA